MHFETLHVDIVAEQIDTCVIGDEVYSGATVEWKGYSKGDREWFFEELRAVFRLWAPALDAESWALSGRIDETGAVEHYSLRSLSGQSDAVPEWSALSEQQRADILERLEGVLESLHALLLIY